MNLSLDAGNYMKIFRKQWKTYWSIHISFLVKSIRSSIHDKKRRKCRILIRINVDQQTIQKFTIESHWLFGIFEMQSEF